MIPDINDDKIAKIVTEDFKILNDAPTIQALNLKYKLSDINCISDPSDKGPFKLFGELPDELIYNIGDLVTVVRTSEWVPDEIIGSAMIMNEIIEVDSGGCKVQVTFETM